MAQDFITPVTSPLHVDRTPPVGNSEGDDGRGRLHVKIANKTSEPLPVAIVPPVPTSTSTYIYNVACSIANTEYSQTLPANTKSFIVKARGNSKIDFAYVTSATSYVTISPGASLSDDNFYSAQTVYFKCSKADEVVEILAHV